MIGRSILSAATRTRVASAVDRDRSGWRTGSASPPDPSGGSVIRGLGRRVDDGCGRSVEGVTSGSAATGFVNDSSPAARNATPSAVSTAGAARVRIRCGRSSMGRAW